MMKEILIPGLAGAAQMAVSAILSMRASKNFKKTNSAITEAIKAAKTARKLK